MYITKGKKPIHKGYTLYDSNYMTFWKKQKTMERGKKNQWFPGVAGTWRIRMNKQRIFRVIKIFLYDIIMVDTCHYTFV